MTKISPGEASTRCNATTKCISGVRDFNHKFMFSRWNEISPSSVPSAKNLTRLFLWNLKEFFHIAEIDLKNFKKEICRIKYHLYQGSFCGPFLLSKPFWVDGGSCVLEGDSPSDQGGGFDFLLSVGVGDGGQEGGFYLQHDDFFSSCVIIFFSLETMCPGHRLLRKHNPLLHQQIWKGL